MTRHDPTIPAYYRTNAWHALRRQTLERDGHVCFYCGRKATTADHVLPRAAGGMDALENLVACCLICNSIAGGRTFKDKDAKKRWLTGERKQRTRKVKGKAPFNREHYLKTMKALDRIYAKRARSKR